VKNSWHIVLVRGGQELAIAAQLRFLDSFVPLYRDPLSKRVLPFVSRYVFARWDGDDPHLWHKIKEITHVYGFIGNSRPTDVVDPIVDQWYADSGLVKLDEKRQNFLRGFGKGDLVRLHDGSFLHGHVGVCIWTDDGGAKIKIGLLGREHEVYRTFSDLTPMSAVPEPDSETTRSRRRRQVRKAWSRQTRMVVA